jgi:hypothetical protein
MITITPLMICPKRVRKTGMMIVGLANAMPKINPSRDATARTPAA